MSDLELMYWHEVFTAAKHAGLATEKSEAIAYEAVATIRRMNQETE